MVIFFDDDDFEPLGQGRDDAAPGAPAGQDDGGAGPAPDTAIDLERIDNGDYLLDAGFAAEAHLGQLVDGDDDGDGNPWTPAGLEHRFYEDMREHLDGAPNPETREALQGDLDRIWDRTRPEIVGREHARRLRKRAAVGEWTLARYRELAAANPALAPVALREAEDTLGRLQGLGAAQDAVDRRRKAFKAELRDAVLNGASEMDPRGALEAFKSGGYAGLFDAGDNEGRKAWEGHLTQAAVTRDDDDAWERERGELENQQMKGLAAVMFRAERERAIRSGDVSGAEITRAVKSGVIGREDGERLRQAALARKDELREAGRQMSALMDRVRADEDFEPDDETAGMVDDWYDIIARPAWDLLPDDQRRAHEENLVRRTGILPAARAEELRRGLNSDDPETVIASAEQLAALREANPAMEATLDPEAFPPTEVERGLKIAAGIKAGHPAEKVLEAVGENEVAPAKSGGPGNEDQVAMGAVGAAGKALLKGTLKGGGKALEQARKRGREIRDLIRQQTRKPDQQGELPKPNPIPAAEIVTTAKRLFDEINEERRAEGKKDQKKIHLTPDQLRPGATAEDAIEGLAEAVMSGNLSDFSDRAVEIRLGKVSDELAAAVKAESKIDISGLLHAIDSQQINHAHRGHGPGNEMQPDQEAISPEVLSTYLSVVEGHDRISSSRNKKVGDTITFEKDIDGIVVVVEQVRRGAQTLSFFNMWIKKRGD